MTQEYDELKELLSFPEALALICFNINYSQRYTRVNLGVLAGFLGLPEDKLRNMARVFQKLEMLKIYNTGMNTELEMLDPRNDDLKDVIYDVVWENKDEYAFMYRRLMASEVSESLELN